MKIQLKRSDVLSSGSAKKPTASQMEYGELAVNYNESDPAIFIKDSTGKIIRIAGTGNIGNIEIPTLDGGNHQSGTLDDRYVEISGDTMTGNLTLGEQKINLNASDGSAALTGNLTLGEQKINLNASDGSAAFVGKVTSSQTVANDSSATLTTKGYVESLTSNAETFVKWDENTEKQTLVPSTIANKVGIGQENPVEKLDVNGSVKVSSRVYYTTGLTADEEDSDMFLANKSYVDAGDHWNETENKLTPKNTSAKVGIGTDSPSYTLDVNGDLAASNFRIDLLPTLPN